MAKEYSWDVNINGEIHRVFCERSTNKYILYVDDTFLINVYREFVRKTQFGLETEVEICGKKCLFIVWDETPDLVVDGVMQGMNTDYEQAREKRKQGCCKGFRILFWIGLLWVCAVLLVAILPASILDADNTVRSVWLGILLMIGGARYKRKWERW